jgi:hypothetical protein
VPLFIEFHGQFRIRLHESFVRDLQVLFDLGERGLGRLIALVFGQQKRR